MSTYLSRIETPKDSYTEDYPQATRAAIEAVKIFWTAEELGVEKDEHDVRVNLTEGERHGLKVAQSIVTQYELMIGGDEMWGGKIARMFPRHEVQRMCSVFAFFELHVHSPFYDLINKTLGIATDEFYESWKEDEVLAERLKFIEEKAASDNPLEVTAALAFLEGVSLFSIFAYFKSFGCRGFNMIPHFVAGIDGSAKDENFHSLASSWLFNQCLIERRENGALSKQDEDELHAMIYEMAEDIYQHELRILDRIFEVGGIRTLTKEEAAHFVRDRVDVVLGRLGYAPIHKEEDGTVSGWFYQQLSTFKYSDFFAATQLQYHRKWRRSELVFNESLLED